MPLIGYLFMGYFKEGEWPYTITSVEESEVWADQSDLKKKVNAIIDSTKYNKKSNNLFNSTCSLQTGIA